MAQASPIALGLSPSIVAALRRQLPAVAGQTVQAIVAEVTDYATTLDGPMGVQIGQAVETALGGFLDLASRVEGSDPSSPLAPALDAAYVLGRGEARAGHSMDALLAAYRVGARVSWREFAQVAVAARLSGKKLAQFAELVFAYIDALSAASVSGHADELATTGRVRQRQLDRLTRSLLDGDPPDALQSAAERADWEIPSTLTAVLVPETSLRGVGGLVDPRTLILAGDLPGAADGTAVLLVPNLVPSMRARVLRSLAGRQATVGPTRVWNEVKSSYQRALRARRLPVPVDPAAAVDTDDHLAALVVTADRDALADLQAQVLAPLAGLRGSTAEKLTETLRAWLVHQGRRDDIASALFIHPQTVRYRMGQLREIYGARLEDPNMVLAATIALTVPTA